MDSKNKNDYINLLEDTVKGLNGVIDEQQSKIEALQKEVEELMDFKEKSSSGFWGRLASRKTNEVEELKERVKDLGEVLRGWYNCNYSEEENHQRTKEILMNGNLTK